jgi:hypothetical protein
MIQAGGEKLQPEFNTLLNSIWNMEQFPHQWNEPIIVLVYKKGSKTN